MYIYNAKKALSLNNLDQFNQCQSMLLSLGYKDEEFDQLLCLYNYFMGI